MASGIDRYMTIEAYAVLTDGIQDEWDNPSRDAFEALLRRSKIEDEWEQLTPQQQQRVREIDDRLVAQHEQVGDMLETLNEVDPRTAHWWWHLDEGPQVRQEAVSS